HGQVTLDIPADQAAVSLNGQSLLTGTSGLTLTPGQAPGNPNPPNTASGKASVFLRAGWPLPDGKYDRQSLVVAEEPVTVEVWVDASSTNADAASAAVTFDPTQLNVT